MKSRFMLLSLIFILCFISACSQKEVELENEEVILYESYFGDRTEDWEYIFSLGKEFNGEITLRMRYLKDIDEELEYYYETSYGDPTETNFGDPITEAFDNPVLTRDNIEFTETIYDQRIIEEACFGQLEFKFTWRVDGGKWQELISVYKDDDNPQCKNFVP